MFKQKISLKARALRFLSMREHSRIELERKLTPHVQEGEDVNAVLDFLENAKYLSNERFSESLVNRRQARFGNQKILAELQSHGLASSDMEQLKQSLADTEVVRAVEVLHRKYPDEPSNHLEKSKQMKFLQQRGFSMRAITAAIRVPREDLT